MGKVKNGIGILLMFIMVLPFAACFGTNKVPDTDQALEIYIHEAGYGIDWVDAMVEDFSAQEWVQTKYPELLVDVTTNSIETFAAERVKLGAKANTIDLFMGAHLFPTFDYLDGTGTRVLSSLKDVYEGTVPGEEITFKEKMQDSFIVTHGGDYYSVPWAGGTSGIIYNVDILDALDIDVPLTTNELIRACQTIQSRGYKNADNDTNQYAIMSSVNTGYWQMMYNTWWGQYEGREEYTNFYKGYSSSLDMISSDVLSQLGRKESLLVMESLLKKSTGYIYQDAGDLDYNTAQSNMLFGNGVFHVNGDWFVNEMKTIKAGLAQRGISYNLSYMRTPVISAIVNRTKTIRDLASASGRTNDQMLSLIIKAIDEGQTSFEGVSEDDFAIISEARFTIDTIGHYHNAVVPEYASAKELAKDFLRYMATDRANKIYTQKTMGGNLPFKFDIQSVDKELYDSLEPMQQAKFNLYNNPDFEISVLPVASCFPSVYYGGFSSLSTLTSQIESTMFLGTFSAATIYQNEIDHWNTSRWNNMLSRAGIAG